jgi:hypothetical protein
VGRWYESGEIGCGNMDWIYVVLYRVEWWILGQYGKILSRPIRNSKLLE